MWICTCFWACALLASAGATASPESARFISLGIAELEQGRFEPAIQHFDAATSADPNDAEGLFFGAVAENRLGNGQAALQRLDRAARLNYQHPDLAFERGWALLSLRRWTPAIEALSLYDKSRPRRGQTHEFLGRAYLALGRYADAEKAFDRAVELDPELQPTISLYRAALEQRRGDELAAGQALSSLLRASPDSSTGQVIRQQLETIPGGLITADKPWQLTLNLGAGYNSNARGSEVFRPNEAGGAAPEQGSMFGHAGLTADYALVRAAADQVLIGYQLSTELYTRRETDADLVDQLVYLEHRHALTPTLGSTLRVSDNHTAVDYSAFRNQLAGRAGLEWRVRPDLAADFSYAYAHSDYLFSTRARQDRDAETHTATLGLQAAIPGTRIRIRGGYFHTWNFADGNDFDYEGDGLFAGLSAPLGWGVAVDTYYVKSFERYRDRNSAAPRPQFQRGDDVEALVVRFTRGLDARTSLYVEYNYNNDESNIDSYAYEQHVISSGIVWRF